MPDNTISISWRNPAWLASGRSYAFAVGGVLLMALAVGTCRIHSLPPEPHDIYTYEMRQRDSWLMPYINGHVRLNKPPLGYWLTMAVSYAAGDGNDIKIWHGHLGSALSGVWLTAAAITIGTILLSRMTGLLTGLLLASSQGLVAMSHSCRPDMLYAAICAWQFAAFVLAEGAKERAS